MDHHAVIHFIALLHGTFHLAGDDPLSEYVDLTVLVAQISVISIGKLTAYIAGAKHSPAIADHGKRLKIAAMVTGIIVGQTVTYETDLTFSPRSYLPQVIIENHHICAVHRLADRERSVRKHTVRCATTASDTHCGLSRPIGIVDRHLFEQMTDRGGVEHIASADEQTHCHGQSLQIVKLHHQIRESADDGDILTVYKPHKSFKIIACRGRRYGKSGTVEERTEHLLDKDVHDASREL